LVMRKWHVDCRRLRDDHVLLLLCGRKTCADGVIRVGQAADTWLGKLESRGQHLSGVAFDRYGKSTVHLRYGAWQCCRRTLGQNHPTVVYDGVQRPNAPIVALLLPWDMFVITERKSQIKTFDPRSELHTHPRILTIHHQQPTSHHRHTITSYSSRSPSSDLH
jgi:hypothetical protein